MADVVAVDSFFTARAGSTGFSPVVKSKSVSPDEFDMLLGVFFPSFVVDDTARVVVVVAVTAASWVASVAASVF